MNIGFSVNETVKQRYSVRTYDPQPVSNDIRENILSYAATIHNPLGPRPRYQFIETSASANGEKLGTYGIIKGASLYLAVTTRPEDGAMEGLGYDLEQLILYMTSQGLGTCWLGGTFNRSAFANAMEIQDGEIFSILSPVGYPATKKRIGESLFRRTLKADQRMPWEKLFFAQDFSSPLTKEAAADYQIPLEMLRLAPSAVNKQPWRVLMKNGAFHFFKQGTMGGESGALDMQQIDVGIGICHFHLAALEQGLSGHFERIEPANLAELAIPADVHYVTSWIME